MKAATIAQPSMPASVFWNLPEVNEQQELHYVYRASYTPKPVEIELSAQEANKIAIQRICDVTGWKQGWYIGQIEDEDWVLETVEAHTTHPFEFTDKIRAAGQKDLFIRNLIQSLK